MNLIDHRSHRARVPITAPMLYALVTCPHRVTTDLFADPADRDAVSPFVQLLWDRGAAHETDTIAGVGTSFLDLSGYARDEQERAGRRFIWDIHGEEVTYNLTEPQGVRIPRPFWDDYQDYLAEAQAIVSRAINTQPGRIHQRKKTTFAGIGPDSLEKFHARAKLLSTKNGKPYLRNTIQLLVADREHFFDIEVDPMRDVCYLHGFVERQGGDNARERLVGFFADDATAADEEKAFAQAWDFMQASQPCVIVRYAAALSRRIWSLCRVMRRASTKQDRPSPSLNISCRHNINGPSCDPDVLSFAQQGPQWGWRADIRPEGNPCHFI